MKEKKIIVPIVDDFDLKAGDRINILRENPQRKTYKVYVRGEVPNQGVDYITKNNTKLYEVIEKAEGLKETADINR